MKAILLAISLSCATAATAAVYEIQMTVSTSTPTETTVKKAKGYCGTEGKIVYRKPVRHRIRAVVWGSACACDAGAVVWNETTREQYDADFAWEFLNRIGPAGTDAEGLWTLDLRHAGGGHAGRLCGGATGKVSKDGRATLSGNLAGYMYAGNVVHVEKKGDCERCGWTEVTVVETAAWGLCDCMTAENDHTVAHGTWTMKCNAKASEKLEGGASVGSAFAFPSYVSIP